MSGKTLSMECVTTPKGAREWALCLVLFALCLQEVPLIPVGASSIKLFHVVVLVTLVCLVARTRVKLQLPPALLSVLVGVFTVVSVAQAPTYGFDSIVLNYIFLYATVFLVQNLSRGMDADRARLLMQNTTLLVLAVVCVNALMNVEEIIRYLTVRWDGHPDYVTVFNGGVNIEVSWLAMFGTLFQNNGKGRAYFGVVLILSLLFSSRSGLVLLAMAALYVLSVGSGQNARAIIRAMIAVLLIGVVAFIAATLMRLPIVERFIGVNPADITTGRLAIWSYSLEVFSRSPLLGVGGGNAMNVVREISGQAFAENNVHNIYLQVLVDYGVIGFVPFLLSLGVLVCGFVRERLRTPYAAFIVLYLIGGMFQFRGADALVGFMLGCWLSLSPATSCGDDGASKDMQRLLGWRS